MSARDVIANKHLSDGGESLDDCYPLHRVAAYEIADKYLTALRSAGFAPPLHTGAIHKALQDAFQAGVNEAFAGRYIRPSSDLVALKHKLCDAALNELLKAAQEDSRG